MYRYRRITQVLRSCSRCAYRRRVDFAWPVGGADNRVSTMLRFSSLLFSSRDTARRAPCGGKKADSRGDWPLLARSIFLSSVRRTWRDRSFVARMPRAYVNTATFSWINADRHRIVTRSTGFLVAGSHYRARQEAQHENPNSFVRTFAHLHEREYNFCKFFLLFLRFDSSSCRINDI